jgi:hypothetical protein
MPLFTKIPVTIEARQFTLEESAQGNLRHSTQLEAWCRGIIQGICLPPEQRELEIRTREGDMRASVGDWIIKGVAGEFYPCKPGIFELVYRPASARERYGVPG